MHSWTNASPISAGVDQHKRSSALLLEKAKFRLVLAPDLLHHSCGQAPGGVASHFGTQKVVHRSKFGPNSFEEILNGWEN